MSNDIVIGGGSSFAVATGELFDNVERLRRVHGLLTGCADDLRIIDARVTRRMLSEADAPISALQAEQAIHDATRLVHRCLPAVAQVEHALVASAEAYGFVESFIDRASQDAAARFGALLGRFVPALAFIMFPTLLTVGVGAAAAFMLLPQTRRDDVCRAIPVWLQQNSAALSDPGVVRLIRLSVMSADDFGAGVIQLPPGLIRLLGDEGLGVVGLATSAAATIALARPTGSLAETPVTTERFGAKQVVSAVTGFEDRAERIPEGDAQIRIDRYSHADAPDSFEVYIAGTRDFGLAAESEPWDMTSNLTAMAGGESGAMASVRSAMVDIGIGAGSPVVFTGHSQGGLIAARLAASGEFATNGLYTLGAPAGQVAVSHGIAWVALEHTDDLVPAIGGTWASADPVIVRRRVFASAPVDPGIILPAHQLAHYRTTAALVDASTEQRLAASLSQMDEATAGATAVVSVFYRARRTAGG